MRLYKYLLFIVMVILPQKMWAQLDILPNNINDIFYADTIKIREFNVRPNFTFSVDTLNQFNITNILKQPFNDLNLIKDTKSTIWLKVSLHNKSIRLPVGAFLYFDYVKINEVYQKNESAEAFKNFEWNKWNLGFDIIREFDMPINIEPNGTNTYYFKIKDTRFIQGFDPRLFSANEFAKFKKGKLHVNFNSLAIYFFLLGFSLVMSLAIFLQFLISKQSIYGFWALYLLANAIYFFLELNGSFHLGWIPFVRKLNSPYYWMIPIQFLMMLSYLLFINTALQIRKHSLKLFKSVKFTIVFLSIIFIFSIYCILHFDFPFLHILENILIVCLLSIFVLVSIVFSSKMPNKKYLLIGSLGLLISASIASYLSVNNQILFWGMHITPEIFYGIGVVFELMFFSISVGERTRLMQLESILIQKKYSKQLETELADRLLIAEAQHKLIEDQRILSLTTSFEQKIAETEITALRSQMNPHFIFNCLNSIKLYSLENDSQAASDYLTKFSKLIRLVLENSRSNKVTLANEVETLQLYIDMEIMRFKNKVSYKVNLDPDIDTQFIEIPPLLIQPFVENAIWHGLMHKPDGGIVTLNITMPTEQILQVEIHDNGIGREKAEEIKSKTAMKHKSFGMKVTNDRIEMINQIYKTHASIHVIDLSDNAGISSGTKVIVSIPV